MADSDSEGMDDWTPGSVQLRPPPREHNKTGVSSRGRRAAVMIEPTSRPLRLNVNRPSGLRNQISAIDYEDEEDQDEGLEDVEDEEEDEDEEEEGEDEEEGRRGKGKLKGRGKEAMPTKSNRVLLNRDSKHKKPIVEVTTEEELEDDADEDLDDELEEEEETDDDEEEEEEQESHRQNSGATTYPTKSRLVKLNAIQEQNLEQGFEQKVVLNTGTGKSRSRRPIEYDDELPQVEFPQDASGEEEIEDGEGDVDDEDEDEEDTDGAALDVGRGEDIDDDDLESESGLEDSRGGTPDPSKLTRRQRAENDSLIALSNEAQRKKVLTAEQITMRRAEMARRRKDLSDKRNEQEKLDTLDKLLHKRASGKKKGQAADDGEFIPSRDEDNAKKPTFIRTVFGYKDTKVGVPHEWDGKLVGQLFQTEIRPSTKLKSTGGTRLVQVVD